MGVARLLAVTATLDAPRIFEESVKLSQGVLSEDRGLVSMDRRALYPGPRTTLAEVCATLGCDDCSALVPNLAAAHSVHFGADDGIGKCYLEFAPDTAPTPGLVFLALKWAGLDRRLNHYTSVTHHSHAAKGALLDALVPAGPVRDAMHASLDLARDGDPDGVAVVLHVTETGTSRASVDISVADARLTLGDVASVIAPVFAGFGVDPAPFLDAHGTAQFGHIAAGMDSKGAAFATLYFGARQL
jgi:hypothetical protein